MNTVSRVVKEDTATDDTATDDTKEDVPVDDDGMTYYDPYWTDKSGNSYYAFNLDGMLFWNYYVCYLSLFVHISIHALFLGMWCDYSKIILLYSFQLLLLHAYSWAIPDRRYAKWVSDRRYWFYGVSGLNILFYMMGIVGGIYTYNSSKDGILQFMGISCVMYTVLSQSLMMGMFAVNYYTLSIRFDYEKYPYHGHVDYPPTSELLVSPANSMDV